MIRVPESKGCGDASKEVVKVHEGSKTNHQSKQNKMMIDKSRVTPLTIQKWSTNSADEWGEIDQVSDLLGSVRSKIWFISRIITDFSYHSYASGI